MKELTPSGWIEVLIGIFLFGSLVGHAAAQKKCWQKMLTANRLENVNDLTKAFDIAKWTDECTSTDLCLQYFPKNLVTGKVKAYMQCGSACGNAAEVKTVMGGNDDDYGCVACNTVTPSSCKDLTAATKSAYNDPSKTCYSTTAPQAKASVTDIKSVPQIFCLDGCQGVTRGGDGKIFVGCATDCNTNKDNGACTNCANKNCEKLIFAPMCYKKAKNQNLETVQLITDAYNVANWKEKCDPTELCLQYYPESGRATGKVSLVVECDASCSGSKPGYQCHACDSRDSGSCKKITDVTSAVKECYEFDSEKKTGDRASIPKIYCFDACQFKETGNKVTVNCAASVSSGTACPIDDSTCSKMIFKPDDAALKTTPPGENQATATTPSAGTATTTRPKTSNKLTTSKYLLGSLAILLFATNQYMRQF